MRHSLFVRNIGTLNIHSGQAQKKLVELNIRINSGLGTAYRTASVEDLINDGLKVDENGNITEAALNEYFQGLSERNKDYVAVKITVGDKELKSCYGPASFESTPVAKSIPPAPVKPLPRVSVPAPKVTKAEVPTPPAPASDVAFMKPGQLKAEFEAQQWRLRTGSKEASNGGTTFSGSVSSTDHPLTTFTPVSATAPVTGTVANNGQESRLEPAWKALYRGLSWLGKIKFWQDHPFPGFENMIRNYKGLPPIGT